MAVRIINMGVRNMGIRNMGVRSMGIRSMGIRNMRSGTWGSGAWGSGTVPLDWQTGVVVPIFKKGDRRVCSNYRGISLLSLPGKAYAGVLRGGSDLTVRNPSRSWNRGPALYPRILDGSWEPNQSTCALWSWRRLSTGSLGGGVVGVLRESGVPDSLQRATRLPFLTGLVCYFHGQDM